MEKKVYNDTLISDRTAPEYISRYFSKHTNYAYEISTIRETNFNFNKLRITNVRAVAYIITTCYHKPCFSFSELVVLNLLLKDLNNHNKSWRGVKGYPVNGQRSHGNANNCKKNKYLAHFRLEQFYQLFGHKKRNIYPTLIAAEYVNKL